MRMSPRPPAGCRPIAPTSTGACVGWRSPDEPARAGPPAGAACRLTRRAAEWWMCAPSFQPFSRGGTMMRPRSVVPLLILLLATPVAGQEPVTRQPVAQVRWDLPAAVADAVVRRLNDPALDLREGSVTVAAGETVAGDLGVIDGPLVLDGTVTGDLLVLNGNATL